MAEWTPSSGHCPVLRVFCHGLTLGTSCFRYCDKRQSSSSAENWPRGHLARGTNGNTVICYGLVDWPRCHPASGCTETNRKNYVIVCRELTEPEVVLHGVLQQTATTIVSSGLISRSSCNNILVIIICNGLTSKSPCFTFCNKRQWT